MINLGEILTKIKPVVMSWICSGWITYTPTLTSSGTAPSLGNGSLSGQYMVVGKACTLLITFRHGTTTNLGSGNISFGLPMPVKATGLRPVGLAALRDVGTNNYYRAVILDVGATVATYFVQLDNATNVNFVTATAPWTWGNGDSLELQITYPID